MSPLHHRCNCGFTCSYQLRANAAQDLIKDILEALRLTSLSTDEAIYQEYGPEGVRVYHLALNFLRDASLAKLSKGRPDEGI